MKIRVKTFAQIKDILGADSSLDYPDGISMKELLTAQQFSFADEWYTGLRGRHRIGHVIRRR